MGSFSLNNRKVMLIVNPQITIYADSTPVTQLELQSDQQAHPTILHYNSLSWLVIERGEKIGIRLRDSENLVLKEFEGIERFPVDLKWCVLARFEKFESSKSIQIPTLTGTTSDETIPGILIFEIEGQNFKLEPFAEPGAAEFFLVFSDETSGEETYGGGRFLYVDSPDAAGTTIIDFNKAYNPPCAFTEFATCPLPPPQNRLPLEIKAGEKKYQNAGH